MKFLRSNAVKSLVRSCAPATRATAPPSSARLPRYVLHERLRAFSTTTSIYKKVEFTQRQDQALETTPASKDEALKHEHNRSRKNAAKTSSLRRVAVEAQRSRGFVKGRGSIRYVDPEVETKVRVTAVWNADASLTLSTDCHRVLRCRTVHHLRCSPTNQGPRIRP